MYIIVEILKFAFFWFGTAIAITTFKENKKEYTNIVLSEYFLKYAIINIIATIILIAINDFRITLIATVIFFFVHKILLNTFEKRFCKNKKDDYYDN